MGEYEDTLKDIEKNFGIVPGFMKAIPKDVLVKDWPLMKKYQLGESEIPAKYRERADIGARSGEEAHRIGAERPLGDLRAGLGHAATDDDPEGHCGARSHRPEAPGATGPAGASAEYEGHGGAAGGVYARFCGKVDGENRARGTLLG